MENLMKVANTPIEISVVDHEPRVDSRLIAQRLGIQHGSLTENLTKYFDEFEQLALLPFQTEAVKIDGQRGTKYHKYALLNEDQAVFALTLSRNTPEVVQLKLDLTIAFKNARESKQLTSTPLSDVGNAFQIYADICERIGVTGNQMVIAANNATVKHTGINVLENMGMTHLIAEKQEQLYTPSDLAPMLGLKPRSVNPILIEAGLQISRRDHKDRLVYELTDAGQEHATYLDTGKKHSDGTPVRQIKWHGSVVDLLKSPNIVPLHVNA